MTEENAQDRQADAPRPQDQVLVLIAKPGAARLDDDLLAEVAQPLAMFNAELRWLEEEGRTAAEIAFTPPPPSHYNPRSLEDRVRRLLMGLPIDVAVLPLGGRRKKLLIADMDSTIIGQECIDELADHAGVGEEVAEVTERAMRGELDFRAALRERLRKLEGLPERVIDEVIEQRICVNNGAEVLVRTMKAFGAHTALVSGGFVPFARHVAEVVGFDFFRANELPTADGRLTGEAPDEIVCKDVKLRTMLELVEKLGITTDDVLAVGDGANDAEMVKAAGLGVAYHAKPALEEVADARIRHNDLSALLYLQGYRRDEFVTSN